MSRVALLGTGAMGIRIAQNLLKANHQVVVYNRTAEKTMPLINQGAVYASTPREAAEQGEIVIGMVTDNDASRTIWLSPETGAVAGLSKDSIAIESSTLTVAWIKELAAAIESRRAAFLDAPVVGSRLQADAGKLIYLVGGKAETLAQVQNILLSAGSSTIHHVGDIGQGMAMKLAVNALFGIQVAALAEIIGMLTRNGITSAKAMECLGELPIISPAAKGAGSLMLMNNHAPMFPVHLVEKDFRYVIQTAQSVDAPVPTSTAIRDIYQGAIAQGYGDDNITGIVQLFT
ncbi:MAG: NAD(P)-dependent oxidoreductase [Coleofasciculus sp. S288]|nr:NAD(P)-dependent oxidoreductase [Coleofasciculus sp. S288]